MRIIGGQWRGRRLASVGKGDVAAHLRPTTDRVRESIFNLLINAHGDPVTNARVLDVFAGTGALGLEALSRGAQDATFIENGRTALGVLRQNIEMLQAPARVVARNVRKLGAAPGPAHDLLFLDPPYGKGLGEVAVPILVAQGWLSRGALLVWEEARAPHLPDSVTLLDQRIYGDTCVTLGRMG
ncbi:MAG: 16S rRNA (guanine(966)-N(2))-methyltransferase RsmD [Pseudomonadota bacterium]